MLVSEQPARLRGFVGWLVFLVGCLVRRRKVPVVLQLSAIECGAACLAMILGYYGRRTTVAECRAVCSPGRDGLSGQTIARAARGFGLQVRAYSTQHADFSAVRLPVIIHWNFNHFVILERWSERGAVIIDPAAGRRRIGAAEFDRRFTGVVIACAPGAGFAATKGGPWAPTPAARPWRAFTGYLLASPALLGQIVLASLLLQAVGFALPALTKLLFDGALAPRLSDAGGRIILGLILIALIKFAVQALRSVLLLQFQVRFDREMMERFFRHLLSLPFQFFEQRANGDLLMRLGSNSVVREIVTGQTLSLVLDGLMMLVYLAVLAVQSPALALVVAAIGLVQALLVWGTRGHVQRLVENDLLAQSAAQGYLVEALNGVGTVKAAGAESTIFDQWQNLFYQQLNTTLRRNRGAALIDSALGAIQLITPLLLIWLGLGAVQRGAMSLGAMLALNAVATLALAPINALICQGQRFQVVASYLTRLFDVFDAQPEQAGESAGLKPTLAGAIELEDVSFGYDPNGAPVLRDLSLQIAPGQKVAIVGRSGSGKSTLARLLLGLYQPSRGSVRFDGVALDACDYRHLRSQCGAVMQDPFLFSGSIRQNIELGHPSATLERVAQAADLAGIHEDIQRMPMGYETRLAEGCSNISGGQRQRLALARALARDPAILVLDEATSHLDTVTERVVEANLARLDCTRIVIAHRMSTVRDADLILVLEGGRLVERGTHAELLARGGHYSELVATQFAEA